MMLCGTYKFSTIDGAKDVAVMLGLGSTYHTVKDTEGTWYSPGTSAEILEKRLRREALDEFVNTFDRCK